ncbi:hypothetical protein [Dankookia sp. P2]|uniref:hypothetical protein n=1 Tax=Dankookia sp. P2 TaxID=3423955 RepID=UPI003D67555C
MLFKLGDAPEARVHRVRRRRVERHLHGPEVEDGPAACVLDGVVRQARDEAAPGVLEIRAVVEGQRVKDTPVRCKCVLGRRL